MKRLYYLIIVLAVSLTACKTDKKDETLKDEEATETKKTEAVKITPIEHASMVMVYKNATIYIDPTGGPESYENFEPADYVVITDIHSDHMSLETLKALDLSKAKIIAPEAVFSELPENLAASTIVINNGETRTFENFTLKAIPMYNLREEALKYHPKGRGNGYVFDFGYDEIYVSGDTEDIPEMRALKDIDKAFICMNLPYTMTVESAASAVLDFKPKQVYPYHYRGTEGFSEVSEFKRLVNEGNKDIEVIQLDWYSKTDEK
ncbi:MBL fold metallo-hydrolase [Lacinutrix chionoecetis]